MSCFDQRSFFGWGILGCGELSRDPEYDLLWSLEIEVEKFMSDKAKAVFSGLRRDCHNVLYGKRPRKQVMLSMREADENWNHKVNSSEGEWIWEDWWSLRPQSAQALAEFFWHNLWRFTVRVQSIQQHDFYLLSFFVSLFAFALQGLPPNLLTNKPMTEFWTVMGKREDK
jgi:hypothetical protein